MIENFSRSWPWSSSTTGRPRRRGGTSSSSASTPTTSRPSTPTSSPRSSADRFVQLAVSLQALDEAFGTQKYLLVVTLTSYSVHSHNENSYSAVSVRLHYLLLCGKFANFMFLQRGALSLTQGFVISFHVNSTGQLAVLLLLSNQESNKMLEELLYTIYINLCVRPNAPCCKMTTL